MKNIIRTLIVDDEKPSRDELKYLLSRIDRVENVGEAEDSIAAVKLITRLEPDIIFLDIQMPEMSGLELAESVQKMERKPYIIFSTAYDDFAIEAFDIGALDYLLKPYSLDRIKKSLDRYLDRLAASGSVPQDFGRNSREGKERPFCITVVKGDNFHPLKPGEIVAVIASGKKTRIVTPGEEYEDHKTISQFEELLEGRGFFRCHRSFLINLNYIEKIGLWFNNTYQLTMTGLEEKVPVSRSNVHEFRKIMAIER